MKQFAKLTVALGLSAAASLGALALSGEVAEAAVHPSTMAVTFNPQSRPGVPFAGGGWPVHAGTSVTMSCWTTGPTQLGTAKWFYINSNAYPYPAGYVPANAVTVSNQAVVGHCA